MTAWIKTHEAMRMAQWLCFALVLYVAALNVPHPTAQTVLWKLGHMTIAGWVGYWIARNLLGRVHDVTAPEAVIGRAIIVGCAMLAMAMGL